MINDCAGYTSNARVAWEMIEQLKIISGGQGVIAETVGDGTCFHTPTGDVVVLRCDHCAHHGYCRHRPDFMH